ncbi:aryl-alcohol dehydrogenase-like predicted oxidoreductase [Paenibacillus endophyticus]|uniref:Aryl-alcohol dehydrogenase-like predicted oxidoreductase n=1 Tax=Paenibacillus endophyticus TaxID=1294268 RepID=A0A7W5CCZ9_9BACL|nr:aldo/keto reductase [Paenibacillus endophyticus]MBB3155463.1 aryl-alcohol dehydrogenase-like predicted oxidoreductase [Paenibacillus endophyticus]
MNYRKLGKTGLEVSALSFGASSLGSVFRETDDAESVRTVHAAIDMGINLIDVSPYYGLTKAESVLGKAIAEISRDRFILSTKAGRYGAEEFDFSEQRIIRSVDESLQRLNTDYIDILFLHDMEFVPFEQAAEGAFLALDKLKQSGKIRFKGVSGLPLSVFEKSLAYTELDAVLSYCHYSLNDTSLLDILPLLEQKQVGLVSASPLSMGLLGNRALADWHPAGDEIRAACKQAVDYCAAQGADITKLAVQFATANESIPTTLVSTANPDNIRKNIEWTDEPIDEALLSEVLAILEPVRNRSWISGLQEYNTSVYV